MQIDKEELMSVAFRMHQKIHEIIPPEILNQISPVQLNRIILIHAIISFIYEDEG